MKTKKAQKEKPAVLLNQNEKLVCMDCGLHWYVTLEFYLSRKHSQAPFCCPNGHGLKLKPDPPPPLPPEQLNLNKFKRYEALLISLAGSKSSWFNNKKTFKYFIQLAKEAINET